MPMTKREISNIAQKLRDKYDEINPEKLCQHLDIWYEYMPLGTNPHCLKGFISQSNRCYCIIINSDLPKQLQRIIMFHEIGHYALNHLQNTVCAFQDYAIYDNAATMENEANMFVAEYLLDTDETMQVLTEQNSFFGTASILEVPPEILDFKWRMLKYYGYLSGQSPISVGSDCLKKMQVGGTGCDEM